MATAGPGKDDTKRWTAKCTTCGAVVFEAPEGMNTNQAVDHLKEAARIHGEAAHGIPSAGPIGPLEIIHHVRGEEAQGLIRRRGRITED